MPWHIGVSPYLLTKRFKKHTSLTDNLNFRSTVSVEYFPSGLQCRDRFDIKNEVHDSIALSACHGRLSQILKLRDDFFTRHRVRNCSSHCIHSLAVDMSSFGSDFDNGRQLWKLLFE